MKKKYQNVSLDDCDVVVALGGDGFMLKTLHSLIDIPKPVYGMNTGSVGFLMNHYNSDNLLDTIYNAHSSSINPLIVEAFKIDNTISKLYAINEVSILRRSHQTAHLKIEVNGLTRLDPLIADGVLVASPAGSTAYNFSAHGPILPLESPLMALTAISAFRPRRWQGAILSNQLSIEISGHNVEKRPISASVDNQEFGLVSKIRVKTDFSKKLTLLHTGKMSLNERIFSEQFG